MTGHVQSLGRGKWRLVVNLPPKMVDGKVTYPKTVRVVKSSGSRAAKERLAELLVQEKARQRGTAAFPVWWLLHGWLSASVDYVRPKTQSHYAEYVHRHIEPYFGALDVEEVTPSALRAFYAKKATVLSGTSCNHLHRTLKAAFTWAEADGIVSDNPCLRVKKAPRPTYRKHKTWSDREIAQAASDARGRMLEVPILLAGFAGMRRGEICALRWRDVDLERGTLTVRQTLEQVKSDVFMQSPKTDHSRRVLPLVSLVRDALARLERLGEYVVHQSDGQPVKPDRVSSEWYKFAQRYEQPITFHELRHSFASNLIFAQGVNIKLAQELLGHADPATTARIYLHPTESVKADVLAAMEARISTEAARIGTCEVP